MKIVFALILLFTLPVHANDIYNGDFEIASTNGVDPDDWWGWKKGTGTVTTYYPVSRPGDGLAAQFQAIGSSSGFYGGYALYPDHRTLVTPGTTRQFTGKYKCSGTGTVKVNVQYFNSLNAYMSNTALGSALIIDDTWRDVPPTNHVIPTNAKYESISVMANGISNVICQTDAHHDFKL